MSFSEKLRIMLLSYYLSPNVPFVLVPRKFVKLSKQNMVWFRWVKSMSLVKREKRIWDWTSAANIFLRQTNLRKKQVWKICEFISLKLSKIIGLFFLPIYTSVWKPLEVDKNKRYELTKTKGINFALKLTYQSRVFYAQKKLNAMYYETYNARSFYPCQRVRLNM